MTFLLFKRQISTKLLDQVILKIMSKTFRTFMSEKGMKSNRSRKSIKSAPKKKLLQDYYQGILTDELDGRSH